MKLLIQNQMPSLWWDGKRRMQDMGLFFQWGQEVFHQTAPVLKKLGRGKDSLGRFERLAVHSDWRALPPVFPEAAPKPAKKVGLEFKLYPGRGLAAAWVYQKGREPLSPEQSARVNFGLLDGFQRGLAFWRNKPWWTVPEFVTSPLQVQNPSQLLLWQARDGQYGILLPLGGSGAKAGLDVMEGDFGVDLSSLSPGYCPARIPAFVAGFGADPFRLCEDAFALASQAMGGSFLPRQRKKFPKVFEGIGWCSWNTYYHEVSAEKLRATVRSFARARFPIQYLLIDDGWFMTKDRPYNPKPGDGPTWGASPLWDTREDPAKFPKGLAHSIRELKAISGAKEVGVWHAFLGSFSYIHPKSPLARRLGKALMLANNGSLVPDPRQGRGRAFYDAWYRILKSQGAGFLKVDDQSSLIFALKGKLPLQDAAQGAEKNLQDAVKKHFNGALINCMCMSWENMSNYGQSSVSRTSDDYFPFVPGRSQTHLLANVYNSFWASRIVWPDFDMFESHHVDGESHAVLRAISGGPVYFTDQPGRENWKILWKLVDAGGRLYRPDQPAQPCRDTLLQDPLEAPMALKAFTRAGECGVVACFNIWRGNRTIRAQVRPKDVEGMPAGKYLVYEHFTRACRILDRDQAWTLSLGPGRQALFTICPIKQGFAYAGLVDKYISAKAVEKCRRGNKRVQLTLREAGEFGFYSNRRPKHTEMNGIEVAVRRAAQGMYFVKPKEKPRPGRKAVVTIDF